MLDDGLFELPLEERIAVIREAKPIVKFPKTPKFPRFGITIQNSPEEVEKYAEALLKYAELRRNFLSDYEAANIAYEAAKPLSASIEKQVTDLIFNDVGLAQLGLPEKTVAKLWKKAWDDANNENEAISNLRELVELFEE